MPMIKRRPPFIGLRLNRTAAKAPPFMWATPKSHRTKGAPIYGGAGGRKAD